MDMAMAEYTDIGDRWVMGIVGHMNMGDRWEQPNHGPSTLCLMAGIRPAQPELMAAPSSRYGPTDLEKVTWKTGL